MVTDSPHGPVFRRRYRVDLIVAPVGVGGRVRPPEASGRVKLNDESAVRVRAGKRLARVVDLHVAGKGTAERDTPGVIDADAADSGRLVGTADAEDVTKDEIPGCRVLFDEKDAVPEVSRRADNHVPVEPSTCHDRPVESYGQCVDGRTSPEAPKVRVQA